MLQVQAFVQMDIRPKEGILSNILEKGIINEKLTQIRKKHCLMKQ